MNAHSQPRLTARGGMQRGAASAPTEAPALKIEVANARSFFGKYSAVTLIAAGKFPASPRASMPLQSRNRYTEVVDMARAAFDAISIPLRAITSSPVIIEVTTPQAACRQAPNDHTPMAMR